MKKFKIISAILLALYSGIVLGQTEFSGNAPAVNGSAANTGGVPTNTSIGIISGNPAMTGGFNTLVGANSGSNITTGSFNTAVGNFALTNNTIGSNNSAMGHQSLRNTTFGSQNTAFGSSAGFTNTIGQFNSYFGFEAGKLSVGNYNCFLGHTAGAIHWGANPHDRNTAVGGTAGVTISGDDNTFLGFAAGNFGMGNKNVAVGSLAMPSCILGSDENVVIGFRAASATPNAPVMNNSVVIGAFANFWNLTGTNNTLVGHRSGFNLSGGSGNSTLGINTALNLVGGNNNTFIGGSADATNANSTLTNAAAIGSNAKVTNNNHMILGDNNVNVGIGLSTDAAGPGNKLEIETGLNGFLPQAAGLVGASGLRFRDLHSNTLPIANPGLGVLSVDALGDVIYVPGGALGNPCGAPTALQNPLPTHWQLPLNNWTYNFTAPLSSNTSEVNIGFAACFIGPGRLNTQTDIHRFAGAFVNNDGFAAGFQCVGVGGQATSTQTDAVGVRGQAQTAPAVNSAIGVEGASQNPASTARFNLGVQGFGSNGVVESAGGRFMCANSSSPENYGVEGLAISGNPGANRDVGGMFAANVANPAQRSIGAAGGINVNAALNTGAGINSLLVGTRIGVYGYNPFPANAINGLNWAGYFQGDVRVVGTPYNTNPTWNPSDKKYKTEIKELENVTEKIKKLNGYTYKMKTEEFPEMNFYKDEQIGFIAQELKEVFPQVVREDEKGFLAVSYQGMIPVLLEAIKEQQETIETQDEKINDLQNQIDELKKMITSTPLNSGANGTTTYDVELSDKGIVVLDQNVPNPFAEQTVINYVIPENTGKAQMLFYNVSGQLIKAVDITEKGKGQLNVFANDLSNGTYAYTLVVDGKIFATKKMEKQK